MTTSVPLVGRICRSATDGSRPHPRTHGLTKWSGHCDICERLRPIAGAEAGDVRSPGLMVLVGAPSSCQRAVIAQLAELDLMIGTLLTVCDHYALPGSCCHLELPVCGAT
jgi:hypothetical protein